MKLLRLAVKEVANRDAKVEGVFGVELGELGEGVPELAADGTDYYAEGS